MEHQRLYDEVRAIKEAADRLLQKVITMEADFHNRARSTETQHQDENLLQRVSGLEHADSVRAIVVEAVTAWIANERRNPDMDSDCADRVTAAEHLLQELIVRSVGKL